MILQVQNELKDHLKFPDQNFHSLIKMMLEVVYLAVDKIKPESTVIQVEAKRLIQVRVGYFKSSF